MSLTGDEKRAIIHHQWMFQKGWAEKAKKSVGAKPPAKGSVSVWVAKLQEKLNDTSLQQAIAKARAEASQMMVEYPPLDINLGAIPTQPLIAEEVMRKRGAEVVAQAKHSTRSRMSAPVDSPAFSAARSSSSPSFSVNAPQRWHAISAGCWTTTSAWIRSVKMQTGSSCAQGATATARRT